MKAVRIIAICVLSAVLLASLIYIGKSVREDKTAQKEYDSVADIAFNDSGTKQAETVSGEKEERETEGPAAVSEEKVDFLPVVNEEELRSINGEYEAWLFVPELEISYPVVWCGDNYKYLDRTFAGEENPAGCLFFDGFAKPFLHANTILLGHNMKNGSMFGRLKKLWQKEYAGKAVSSYIYVDGEWRRYQLVSSYVLSDDDEFPYQMVWENDAAFEDYKRKMLSRSEISYAQAQDMTGDILTLSTCNGDGYLRVAHFIRQK